MQHARLFAHVLAFGAFALTAVAQTTWYVDVNATSSGSGTQADPYASIQYAIDQTTTVNSDTVLVLPGTYVEQIHTHGKRIALLSSGGPVVTTITTDQPGTVVRMQGHLQAGTVLEGFSVTSTGANSRGVLASSGTVRRCLVYGTDTGVQSDFDAWIEECTITGNAIGLRTTYFAGCAYGSNSIIWGNTLDFDDATQCSSFDHCVIATRMSDSLLFNLGGTDPDFWDAANLDLHLSPGSNAIDAGNPNDPLDPDGSVIDIGALTYDPAYAPSPTVYCTAKTNSLGCVPQIGATGQASASGAPFTVTCVNQLNNKLGLLFYGYAPKSVTYQGGWLCVQSPVQRTSLVDSGGNVNIDDCSGVHSFDFDARIQSGIDPALDAGVMVYAQFWSRDPAATFTTVRSDALRFGVGL